MDILDLHAPSGTAWELCLVMVTIIVAPILVERLRIPGMIGLLAGGCILGPSVLGAVGASSSILQELGDVGLLYLMFVAGLELDLAVFARHKRHAVIFCALTFSIPLVFGMIGGFTVGYGFAAALLLGSLFASYTLVVYPRVRDMGLATNPAVASTVGATVLTDTMALVVLAVVAGTTGGDANGAEIAMQVVVGLAVLAGYCFFVLPPLARWFFRGIGTARTVRYAFMLAALLSAGALAESVGIDSIVGAFFCGLALNRLVPNEGAFMEHIEFFGSALLIPAFLVSVGTVIDPVVLVQPATLRVAAVFTVACIGGKLVAALLCRPLLGTTGPETGVVFALSVAQAAATLAATFVGLQVGLFTTSTVNAVMIVIVVSLVLASVCAERYGARMDKPAPDASRIGRTVLTEVRTEEDLAAVLAVAERLSAADSGVVRPTFVVADGQQPPPPEMIAAVAREIDRLGMDAELRTQFDRTVTEGLLHHANEVDATIVVAPAHTQSWLPALLGTGQHSLVASSAIPSVLVRPGAARFDRVVLLLSSSQAKRPTSAAMLAAAVADKVRQSGLELVVIAAEEPRPDLLGAAGVMPVTVAAPNDWITDHGRDRDLVVVPGGRNGALTTARATKAATLVGATIAVVADRESVAAAARGESLGVLGGGRMASA